MNARSSTDFSGTHFSLLLGGGYSNVVSDYNLYYTNGNGGNIASFDNATTMLNTIKLLRETLMNQDFTPQSEIRTLSMQQGAPPRSIFTFNLHTCRRFRASSFVGLYGFCRQPAQ